jgi:phosphatidylglycerophosphatase A
VISRITRFIGNGLASLFFLGYIPGIPGTVGAGVTTAGIWYLHTRVPSFFASRFTLQWVAIVAITALAIFLIRQALPPEGSPHETENGKNAGSIQDAGKDPPHVILDELVGQCVTFFMIPLSWRTLLLGFLLFRFFDIIKPFPVHTVEAIKGATGIVADDFVAGIYANISVLALLHAYLGISSLLHA